MNENQRITIESYNKIVDKYIELVDRKHPIKQAEKFLSLIKPGSSILDLGCGPGRDAKIFADKDYKVTGVDLAENMIKAAKNRVPNAEFKVMNINNLEFIDNSFDAIWSSMCFPHVPKDMVPDALTEAFRVLNNEGIMFVSIKKGEGEFVESDTRYNGEKKLWSFYQPEEFKKLLIDAGFKIAHMETVLNSNINKNKPRVYFFCKKSQ